MAKGRKKANGETNQKPIEQYEHKDKKRLNNPPVGLVDAHTDNGGYKKQIYQYDPHLDPSLQWAGKAEHTSFEVPTVSLHVHERIDPRRIIEQIKKEPEPVLQLSLFQSNTETKGLSKALEFYKHKENWSNRLIAGDSLLVMNSLLQKEAMSGKVQMVFFDPPYGITYGSNFQPFVNKRDVKDGKDEDLTAEPEMIKAFRDTWELGIHSYLTYMRDRLKLAKDLLHESGCVFVQISDENMHHVREIMDDIFEVKNFVSLIAFKKGLGYSKTFIPAIYDYLIVYAKDKEKLKYRKPYIFDDSDNFFTFSWIELPNGERRRLSKNDFKDEKLITVGKLFQTSTLMSKGAASESQRFTFEGKDYYPSTGAHWKTKCPDGLDNLQKANRLIGVNDTLAFIRYKEDFPYKIPSNVWDDTIQSTFASDKIYVVQTNTKVVQRCILMTTDPGDLVLDITCGSGTTAFVAENWGRRWLTCDTSRVALTLAKQRLMTASFDYFELAYPLEGIGSGLKYKSVPHPGLKSFANKEENPQEFLFDKPIIDNKKERVSGPFTVEAVPAPVVKTIEEAENILEENADVSVARSGETLRQNNWIDELKNTGVRGKQGNRIEFTRMETAKGLRYVQAEGETKEAKPKKVYVVFAPEHAPLEQRMVELAWEEVKPYKPDILLFCALQFDEEAAKDIDEMNPEITRCQFLKAQMNADLMTSDLRKKQKQNESFWLIGQPDVRMKELKSGEHKGKFQVEVHGFDYYNPKTGTVDSGGKGDIAMWMLDTDYDGRSLFPSQVFFPMAGSKEGWATIAKNLKAEIDEEKMQTFYGTTSLPFIKGKAVAVKIIDARGIESLKIIRD